MRKSRKLKKNTGTTASVHDLGTAPETGIQHRVSVCQKCGGEARAIASIEDQPVIDKILAHLMKKGALPPPELLPATRPHQIQAGLHSSGFHTYLHDTVTETPIHE